MITLRERNEVIKGTALDLYDLLIVLFLYLKLTGQTKLSYWSIPILIGMSLFMQTLSLYAIRDQIKEEKKQQPAETKFIQNFTQQK